MHSRDRDGYLGGARRLAPRAVSVVAPEEKSQTSPAASMRPLGECTAPKIGYEPSLSPTPMGKRVR